MAARVAAHVIRPLERRILDYLGQKGVVSARLQSRSLGHCPVFDSFVDGPWSLAEHSNQIPNSSAEPFSNTRVEVRPL